MGMFEGVDEDQKLEDSGLEDVQPEIQETPADGIPENADGGIGEPPVEDEGWDFEGVKFSGLTPDQIAHIQKHSMLQGDYTRKTQELAEQRRELDNIHQTMMQDPNLFLQYFPPQYLEHVLGMVKGQQQPSNDGLNLDEFEPEVANVIGSLRNEIDSLKSVISQHDNRFSSFDEERIGKELTDEVDEAINANKRLDTDYDRKLIYSLIANNGSMSAADAAAQVLKWKQESWSDKVKAKQKDATKVVGAGRTSVPAPKAAKTFDEADKSVDARLGAIGG